MGARGDHLGRLRGARGVGSRRLGDVDGLDVVELGCGTAYVSAWLARRGARPVGVDVTPAQLATARRCQERVRARLPARRGECRGRAAPLGELRPRRLGVRREHLVRPAPLAAGGVSAPAAGRPALVSSATARSRCSARPTRRAARGAAAARPAGHGADGVARRDRRRVAAAPRRALSPPAADGLRGRRPRRALRTGRRGRPRVLRGVLGRLGATMAGRGDLGRGEAPDDAPRRSCSRPRRPQRRAILEQLRVRFEAEAPAYEEHDPPDADPVALVRSTPSARRARCDRPGQVDARRRHDGPPRRDRLREAGATRREAAAMLEALAGRTHEVVSGLCLLTRAWEDLEHETTRVTLPPARRASSRTTSRAASGRAARAATRSRASARRWSSGSRATT